MTGVVGHRVRDSYLELEESEESEEESEDELGIVDSEEDLVDSEDELANRRFALSLRDTCPDYYDNGVYATCNDTGDITNLYKH